MSIFKRIANWFNSRGCIPWDGQSADGPMPPDTRVQLLFRNGECYRDCLAGDYSWRHSGADDDIVGYLPENPQVPPERSPGGRFSDFY